MSYLEIYNENLYDLLSEESDGLSAARAAAGVEGNHTLAFGRANEGVGGPSAPNAGVAPELTITEDKQGGTHVRGLTRVPVRSAEEALSSLFEGDANRAVAEHALNAASTRSHCVFTLYLERVYSTRGGGAASTRGTSDEEDDGSSTETVRCKLHLVDLAGSERIGKTHTVGGTAVQASFINKSLTFLEQVVLALLSSKREHVPYRSSKLTNMLKDSLGGNCRTRMVACVWPDTTHAEESIATLRFATRMMKVKTTVKRNVASSGAGAGRVATAKVIKYEAEIKALRRELAMHDALVGRTGVRYGPLSSAEGGLISELCDSYVDAPSDDEDEGGVARAPPSQTTRAMHQAPRAPWRCPTGKMVQGHMCRMLTVTPCMRMAPPAACTP
jgi:kinesin family protein 6/9